MLSVNTEAVQSVSALPLRPPVSRFARAMWPPERGVSTESEGRVVGMELDEERRNGTSSFGAEVAYQSPIFESPRERQLNYRPREWRQRKGGEWQDTGPFSCDWWVIIQCRPGNSMRKKSIEDEGWRWTGTI